MYGSVPGKVHGRCRDLDEEHTVKLNAHERITSAFGTALSHWDFASFNDRIANIGFRTNLGRTIGPWGTFKVDQYRETHFEIPERETGYLKCVSSRIVWLTGHLSGLIFTFDIEC